MVTFDNGDLIIRVPKAGTFEQWTHYNAALFEAYHFALKTHDLDDVWRDPFMLHLLDLAKAMQSFDVNVMSDITGIIEAATVRKGGASMNTPVILTDADNLTLKAAKDLIRQTEIANYQAAIWEMFECWIGSDLTDGVSHHDRASIWFACKWMNDFFEQVKKAS